MWWGAITSQSSKSSCSSLILGVEAKDGFFSTPPAHPSPPHYREESTLEGGEGFSPLEPAGLQLLYLFHRHKDLCVFAPSPLCAPSFPPALAGS